MSRRRVLGLGVTAGAFLAFGMTPMAGAPPANADELDVILDPIINSLSAVDPTLGAELSTLATSIDPTFADSAAVTASTPDFAELFNQYVYAPTHTALEDWINSNVGHQVDGFINSLAGSYVIGNGAPGTEASPDGGAGGSLFGDGGPGWNSTVPGEAGGSGGAAGLIGDGGRGGDGGAGADGRDGGAGGSFMGVGGDGGNAGDGATADGLPALGGAGGGSGPLGIHGAVGDFGTAGAVSGSDAIGTTGSWLTNADGQVVMLHGLNEVYKIPPGEPSAGGFSDDDAAFLAANGFNAVRLGIIWADLEPAPGVFNAAYLASIEQTVQTLGNHGIHSILDFHQDAFSTEFGGEGAPAWAVQDGGLPNSPTSFPLNIFFNPAEQHAWDAFWTNAAAPNNIGLEDNYAQMLEYVGNAFNGNANVAGFELINEPSPGGSTFFSTLFGSPFFDSQQLTPFYNQGADAIRAVDPTTPIFFEPNVLSNASLPTDLGTVNATNTVLSFHDYCEFDLGPLGCLPSVGAVVGNAEAYAQAHGIPAFMTEFGATSTQTQILAPLQGADQHLIGWTEWAYSGQGDITTSASPPGSESLVFNPELPPTGTNVNTANLDTLAEPYPQLISGTPTSYSFENGTFSFSYSTAEADGMGSFPAGSQTTIAVPTVEFPNGYDVVVTGGHVVSAPDAPELVIASDSGASTVSVTVSPAT